MSSRSFDASAEVARELGMKVGAVFQAKHRVIAQLRREIQILQGSA
jgi:DNA-directed RNA polymerase specialized sigma24 family protein